VLEAALLGGLAILAYVVGVWALSLSIRNASIMDIFWGPGFLLAALAYLVASPDGDSGRQTLVVTLVAIWSLRLAAHIFVRNSGQGEDPRYRKWREEDPETFWYRSLYRVFLLQGGLLWVISAPLLLAINSDEPNGTTLLDTLGFAVWLTGFVFEAVGDYQLVVFKSEPGSKGKVMDQGLWKYTRHPNYFGEATLWWGYFIIALSVPWGWVTIFSPIIMTYLLVNVSGAALLERGLKKGRSGYDDYVRRTSGFVPMPPKADRPG
jgi:steroid 5-alpha reductase family enzyme